MMKKNNIGVKETIVLLFIAISAIFLAGCTVQETIPETDTKIQFETYGAFTIQEMSKQLLTIDEKKITYITADPEGKITSMYTKPITAEEYSKLITLLNDNNFLALEEKYTPKELVSDVGAARVTVAIGNKTKTVTVEPYITESLPKNVKKVFDTLQDIKSKMYDMNDEELKAFAEEWITKSPTYSYDGSELTYVESSTMESYPVQYSITYTFKSSEGGFGDRKNMMNIQVITDHTIVLTISQGKVTRAVIDGKWDELNQVMIGESEIKFTPMQCVDTPWRKWYKDGNIQFVKEPSEEELVILYYGQVYDIILSDFKLVHTNNLVVALCGENESYYLTAKVDNQYKKRMIQLGWTD
ncbi:MAG: hypothetical protein ACP5NV_01820 [Candidatus Woesearchaeota archaeon]